MSEQVKMRMDSIADEVGRLKVNTQKLQYNINRLLHYIEYFKKEYDNGKYIKRRYKTMYKEWFYRV